MRGFCIRSFGIVSPTPRPWFSFTAAPRNRFSSPIQNLCTPCLLSSVAFRPEIFSYVTPHAPATSESAYEFTPSHVARTASQAIRVAIRSGKVRHAYYAVDSMLHASLDPKIKPSLASLKLTSAMRLGRPLPSRLAAHSLVHALIHEGHILEAGWALQKMMSVGVRFHTRTIEANVNLLTSGFLRSPHAEEFVMETTIDPPLSWGDSDAGIILASQSTRLRPETHLALNILDTARKWRRRRTESMYGWLIDACLLQGEIIVATLLFVILVKDWQLRKALRPPLLTLDEKEGNISRPSRRIHEHLFEPTTFMHATRLGFDRGSPRLPYPERRILQTILNSINYHVLSRDSHDDFRLRSIESLSILANLLRDRGLPFGQIAPLLRTLQNCPSSPPCKTGVLRNGAYAEVNAYDYVHEVLHDLCEKLSAQGPNLPPKPSLDLRAYNTLIFYALRHRLSPALANSIIEHMTVHRKPPLQPDRVTYNTCLRASSLLSRNDIASKVLEQFRKRKENSGHIVSRIPPDIISREQLKRESGEKLRSLFELIQTEEMTVPDFVETPRRAVLQADLYTLSSYITHLVSIGLAELVAQMIFQLLPELHIIDHPAGGQGLTGEWTRQQRQERHQECIARAVEYGPFVFSALLNALRKAGKTGLAERVWLLARQAEQASWLPPIHPSSPAPWCLPIHAYTSMMQCYANESKKGLACIRGTRFSTGLSASLYTMRQGTPWVPQLDRRRNIYTKGWAYFYLRMQAKEQGFQNPGPPLRLEASRAVGRLLHKAMRKGGVSVWQTLQRQQQQAQQFPEQWAARLDTIEHPSPDARFFDVMLDIFGRRPNMQARRGRASLSWWNRRLRVSQRLFATTGWLSLTYDHTLVEIGKAMAQAGYPLPIGLQRALVGRSTYRVQSVTQKYEIRPWAFPPHLKPNVQPFSLPVIRSRGLPLGRRCRSGAPHRGRQTRRRRRTKNV
jgi:hypothetical protein